MDNRNINMSEMASALKEKHGEFIKKYGLIAGKKIADMALQRDQVYARLALVAKAFEMAGVAPTHKEVDVRAVKESYLRSVALETVGGTVVYMLNGCDHVIVTDGAISEDPINRTLVLLSSVTHTSFIQNYDKVLDNGFDWGKFSLEVLDAVHQVAYHRTEVMGKYLDNIVGGKDA